MLKTENTEFKPVITIKKLIFKLETKNSELENPNHKRTNKLEQSDEKQLKNQ